MIITSSSKHYEKLEELILCVTESASDLGITKLEKLLYLCDFEALETLGDTITGDIYKNFRWGPVPKHFIPAYENLLKNKRLDSKEIKLRSGKDFNQLTPIDRCKAESFTTEQWGVIKKVLSEYGNKSVAELVKLTHDELTWKLTEPNEEIPEFLAHYRNYKKPTERELEKLTSDPDYLNSVRVAVAR